MNHDRSAADGRPRAQMAWIRGVVTVLCVSVAAAASQAVATPPAGRPDAPRTLRFQTGRVEVRGGIATIDLPEGWRYLQRLDARYVIEREWNYPTRRNTLGLVLPPKESSRGGIVVSYDASGYIDDRNANLNPDLLLEQMREDAATINVGRGRRGITGIELVGWADPPHYDATTHKLRWGMVLQIGEDSSLSYDMRILAADGVLVMKVLGAPGDIPSVVADARLVLARTELTSRWRHAAHAPNIHIVDERGMANFFRLATGNRVGPARVLLRPFLALTVVGITLFASRRLPRRRSSDRQGNDHPRTVAGRAWTTGSGGFGPSRGSAKVPRPPDRSG